jgi:hypothetical protein
MSTGMRKQKVGEVRPAGPHHVRGRSIIDLPYLSVMVMDLEDWPDRFAMEVGEERLLSSVRRSWGRRSRP